jgi:hypothetical protein
MIKKSKLAYNSKSYISFTFQINDMMDMKKILTLFFLITFAGMAHAQIGIRAGLNSSNFSSTDYSNKTGFHLGGYYLIKKDFISIEPGIQYSQKGYNTVMLGGSDVSETLGYLDVPLLFRLNFLSILNAFAGPQASVLLSRNYESGNTTSTSTDVIRGYDMGGVVGVGVSVFGGLNAQISYDMGFTNLNYFDVDVKNRVLKLSLGYTF